MPQPTNRPTSVESDADDEWLANIRRKREERRTAPGEWDAHIKRVVDAAPPVSNKTRSRLALLLVRGEGGA